MSIGRYIFSQVDGFFKAGKKPVPAKSHLELTISRTLAILLLLVTAATIRAMFLWEILPARIYLRLLVIAVAAIAFARYFFKGISLSWLLKGLLKYWLFPLYLLTIYLVLGYISYVIITGTAKYIQFYQLMAGIVLTFTGLIFGIYFHFKSTEKADKAFSQSASRIFNRLSAFVFYLILIGGIIFFLNSFFITDWFFEKVLGW